MMRTRYLMLMALVGVLLLGIGTGTRLAPRSRTVSQPDPALRTVVVVTRADAPPMLRGDDIAVRLEAGAFPAGGVARATVLTDTNCAPDAEGVSHCLNEMQAGKAHFTVRHSHRMMEVPCFSPTEEVNIVDVATYASLEGTRQ
jgi:hypothetical protein